MAIAYTSGDDLDSLQAVLNFVSSPDIEVNFNGDEAAKAATLSFMAEMNDPEAASDVDATLDGLFPLETFDETSSASRHRLAQSLDSHDVTSIIVDAPWPKVSSTPKARRRYASSRKDEIKELRKVVQKLTKKLEKVKTTFGGVPDENAAALEILDKSPWKDIVVQQFGLRKKSEVENKKLRKEVTRQVHNASNLKRMLKRRYNEEMLEMMPLLSRSKVMKCKKLADNERIFRELLSVTDLVYAAVDELYVKKGMLAVPCPGLTKRVSRGTVNGVFLEFLNKIHVPFSLEKTTQAVWKAIYGPKAHDGDHIQAKVCAQDTQHTDNTTTCYISYTSDVPGFPAFVQERRVARKYVEKNRSVFICRTMTEPKSRRLASLGILLQETVTIVVTRGKLMASNQETAVIKTFVSVTRRDEGKQEADEYRGAAFSDIAVKCYESAVSLYRHRVEHVLFDNAISCN